MKKKLEKEKKLAKKAKKDKKKKKKKDRKRSRYVCAKASELFLNWNYFLFQVSRGKE